MPQLRVRHLWRKYNRRLMMLWFITTHQSCEILQDARQSSYSIWTVRLPVYKSLTEKSSLRFKLLWPKFVQITLSKSRTPDQLMTSLAADRFDNEACFQVIIFSKRSHMICCVWVEYAWWCRSRGSERCVYAPKQQQLNCVLSAMSLWRLFFRVELKCMNLVNYAFCQVLFCDIILS